MNRRRGSGEWIVAAMAEHADVRTLGDALAFIACGVAFVLLGLMALWIGGAL